MNLKGKRIIVTGADGFIGSHLVESLLDTGAKVNAFCCYNSFSSWGWLDRFKGEGHPSLRVFIGDIRDANGVRKAMKESEVVFHLAALIGIPFSYHSPDSYIDTNIKGTLNLLQAALDYKIERFLVTSSSEVYGTAKKIPIDETHPLQGQSPYSASKIGADMIAESFLRSYNLPVAIVRPFNTYGPRQSARAVVPTIIIQLLAGDNEIRLGTLAPTRDFNYIEDVCNGFLAIAASDKTIGETINIASGTEISIGGLARKLIDKINPEAKIILDEQRIRPKNSEVMRLLGSNKKITELTGWQPRYTLDEGLDETIEWFRSKIDLTMYKAGTYNV